MAPEVAASRLAIDRAAKHVAKAFLASPAQQNHIVQFYEDDAFLVDVIAHFVGAGLEVGEPLVIVARQGRIDAVSQQLVADGFEVEALRRSGQLTLLDAHETLAAIMVDGLPDAERFHRVIGAALERSASSSCHARVRAYGEMVDVLWHDGNSVAALQLEALWNEIGARYSFSLLCAYGMDQFADAADGLALRAVCDSHTHVLPTERYSGLGEPDQRMREVTALQQRARALETEIEHRKQVEQALRESLSQRDEFVAIAGHELKTPLTSVRLLVQSLQTLTRDAVDPRVQERLSRASRGIDRLGLLFEQLLDVSRINVGGLLLDRREVELGSLVREVIDGAADALGAAGCTLELLVAEPLRGHWDRMRLEQVVSNLLTNAIKYGRGKPIAVRVDRGTTGARLMVRDQGIGIAPGDQARIFGRFERAVPVTSYGGLGLGLFIVRQAVDAHGGTIVVTSEPGRGATFTVELPYGQLGG